LIVKRKELQGRREYQRKREEVTNHQLHIQIPKRKREEVTNNQLHPNSEKTNRLNEKLYSLLKMIF
jgi:hypothetical protein